MAESIKAVLGGMGECIYAKVQQLHKRARMTRSIVGQSTIIHLQLSIDLSAYQQILSLACVGRNEEATKGIGELADPTASLTRREKKGITRLAAQ